MRVEDAVLHVRDEITGVDWRADQATLRITRDEDGVRAEARGVLATDGGPARLRLSARAGPSMRQVLLEAELHDAIPAFLFPSDGPLGVLSGIQAPISVSASAAVDEARGLLGADLDVSIGAGVVTVLGQTHDVRSSQVRASYDPVSGALSIASAEIDVGVLRGRFRGRLDAASDWLWGAGEGPYVVDLLGQDVVVDLRPTFRAPLDAARIELHGAVSPATATLAFESLEIDTRELRAAFAGQVRMERASDGRLLPALQLDGPITGIGTVTDVLDFWPVELADGAREWVEEGILGGRVTGGHLFLDLPVEALVAEQIDDELLALSFDFEGATAAFVSTMSPVTGARGSGTLFGNHFTVDVEAGELAGLVLMSGYVDLPRLKPKGAVARFGGEARGRVDDVLAFIDEPPLEFPSSYGIDPRSISGSGTMTFEITRPMLVDVPPEDIGFEVEGHFSGVSAPSMMEGLEVLDADVVVRASPDGLTAIAEGFLGPAPAHLVWSEDFSDDVTNSTSFHVEADFDGPAFDKLGIPARRFLSGVAHVTVDTRGVGFDIVDASVVADLTDAALRVPETDWTKPLGAPSDVRLTMTSTPSGGRRIHDAVLIAPGADIAGEVELSADGRLESARFDRFNLDRIIDAAGTLERGEDGTLIVRIAGANVDARGVVSQLMNGDDEGLGAAFSITAGFDRATLGDGVVFADLSLDFEHNGVRAQALDFSAVGSAGPVTARIVERDDGERVFRLDAPDAGEVIDMIFGINSVRGGSLAVDAVLPALDAPEDAPTEARIIMRDFTLAEAPAVAQVLTLGSLQGLGNTLAGGGIRFSRLDAPVTLTPGRVDLREARASGQALGVTVSGSIDLENEVLDLDGVLVPAYGINSILGGVPVIGDIFVSRRGEGIFALTYSIDGPFAETRVFVNPLSALAPGFLRRLFEPVTTANASPRPRGDPEDGG